MSASVGDVELNVSRHESDAQDAAPPSTLYDPAALHIDPKYLALLDQKKAEQKLRDQQGNADAAVSHNRPGFSSPHSSLPRTLVLPADKEDRQETQDEIAVCCCGTLSLHLVIIVVNVLAIIVGCGVLVAGIFHARNSPARLEEGMAVVDAALLSGPYLFGILAIVSGLCLVLAGCIGIGVVEQIKTGQTTSKKKIAYVLYQSLILLMLVLFTVFGSLNIYALWKVDQTNIYTDLGWLGSVPDNPSKICDAEQRLGCAGFSNSHCNTNITEIVTAYRNCPGHYCIDFCRVEQPGNVNPNVACEGCRAAMQLTSFAKCRAGEITNKAQGCSNLINGELQAAYRGSLSTTICVLMSVLILLTVASFRSCCMPPTLGDR
jgi:hypothetical protein